MASTIDGLVSGMNTTEIVSQLMRLEAAPQTALKNRVTAQQKAISAYQAVNGKMAALTKAATALTNPDTWGLVRATSSTPAVATVTAGAGAASGSLTFRVDQLAAAHTVTFGGSVGSTTDADAAPVMSGDSFDVLTKDGPVTVTPGDASLQSVVKAINETPDALYRAAAVQVSPGQFTLQLTAKTTGQGAVFAGPPAAIDKLGVHKITTQGQNAQLTVGTTADAYQVTSATNTFSDLLPGVSVTATREQAPGDARVTVTLAEDRQGLADRVQSLVDAVNGALTEIASQSRVKTNALAAGPLVGDAALRKLSQDILSSVAAGAGDLGSLSAVGVRLERDGTLTFDRQKFLDRHEADPDTTRAYFDSYTDRAGGVAGKFNPGWDTATGLARRLEAIGLVATEGVILPGQPGDTPKRGLLPELIQRKNDFIGALNDQVAAWDVRLAKRKTALEKQYSGLEVALGKLQSQSNWLAGQLAGLARQ